MRLRARHFSGPASVTVESPQGKKEFPKAGARPDVFSGKPTMIYLPPGARYVIKATTDAFDASIFSAPSQSKSSPAVVEDSSVVVKEVGRANWQRTVYTSLGDDFPAERLLAGETLSPPGNWSSYPPHKHDRMSLPAEAPLEEIYSFRVKPAQGFGLIWTYTVPEEGVGFSTVFVVQDGDTVLLPKGYHPVVAAPGYQLHYTWVLAGGQKRYGMWNDDPRHAWVKNT